MLPTVRHEEDFASAIASTEEHEFRRFRLGQWTATRSVALPTGAWEACKIEHEVKKGSPCVVAFVAARQRDCIALVASTFDGFIFPIAIFEPGARVEPREVAGAIRECFGTYDVRELICPGARLDVGLDRDGVGAPIVKMPLSPQRLGKSVAGLRRRRAGATSHTVGRSGAGSPRRQPHAAL